MVNLTEFCNHSARLLEQLVQDPLTHMGVSMGAGGGKRDFSGWPIKCKDLCCCLFC